MADEPAEEQLDPLALFSKSVQQPVEGLMFLGKISERVEFCGHSFELRTLLPQDKFAISVVLQPYRNTIMEVDAFAAAHVAMALTMVDDDPDFCPPIGPGIESNARARFNWLSERFYPPAIDYLWTQYQFIEAKATQAMQELDRLSKGSQPTTLPPWLDSFTAPGTSSEPTSTDTPPSTPSSSSS